MVFSAIFVKVILFCAISTVNTIVREKPLSALESVFVMEIIQEAYGPEEEDGKD